MCVQLWTRDGCGGGSLGWWCVVDAVDVCCGQTANLGLGVEREVLGLHGDDVEMAPWRGGDRFLSE